MVAEFEQTTKTTANVFPMCVYGLVESLAIHSSNCCFERIYSGAHDV